MNRLLKIVFLSSILYPSCQKENLSLCENLNNRLSDRVDFYLGTAVDLPNLLNNQDYSQIINNQFNSVTAENIMKPAYLHPSLNTYYWTEADQLADYCIANSKRLHGHTLIWHNQLPEWILNYQGSTDDWENLLREHIFQIVNHFKGKVSSWDVVNEAFNDDGTLRNSIWKEKLGPSYIEKAFNYARQADPNAKLFYNDYSLAINPMKRTAVLNCLNSLKSKGTPIDGIGMQMHIFNSFPENNEISNAINEIWKNDYLVHISELDISINPFSHAMQIPPEDELKRQAEKYLYIFKTYDNIPDQYKFGITIWGVSDNVSWIRKFYNRDDFPLLFDDNYQPKPAFCKLISNL